MGQNGCRGRDPFTAARGRRSAGTAAAPVTATRGGGARGWRRGHPRYAAVDQNGVDGTAAAPVNSTGSWRVLLAPPRTSSRPVYIGSLSRPSGDGAKPIANAPTTRCWPARNEVEM